MNDIKQCIYTPEYDFLKTNNHLGKNIILLAFGGSHSYGTNIETSDIDVRGIALNSKEEILLQKDFEQVVDDATDTTIYSFNKIVKLLAEANPNTLEILFQNEDAYIELSEIGKLLVENRHVFLSKKCFYTFGGYARQQLRRLDNKSMRTLPQPAQEVHILNSINNAKYSFHDKYFDFEDDNINLYIDKAVSEDLESEIFMNINLTHYPLRDYKSMWMEMHNIVKEYGKLGKRASNAFLHNKVNKHAMHLVRLMLYCIDILETGTFNTHAGRHLPLLLDIRNGKYMGENNQMTDEFFKLVDSLEKQMQIAFENTKLPDKPDMKKINEIICIVNEKVVTNNF